MSGKVNVKDLRVEQDDDGKIRLIGPKGDVLAYFNIVSEDEGVKSAKAEVTVTKKKSEEKTEKKSKKASSRKKRRRKRRTRRRRYS